MCAWNLPSNHSQENTYYFPQPTEGLSPTRCESMWIPGTVTAECIFDVRVFNPCTLSCRGSKMDACYRQCEREKCQAYKQRVREVERGSFTPLVFTSGGMS